MSVQRTRQSSECAGEASAGAGVRPPNFPSPSLPLSGVLRNFAPQDWLVIAYFAYLNLALLFAPGTGVLQQATLMGLMFVATTTILVLVRSNHLRHGLWAPLLYRLSLQGAVQCSYFLLASYLPVVNPRNLDAKLYALDLNLFGFEPSLVLDAYVSTLTSEWFAFFYFCYFFLLLAHTIPIVLFSRNQRLISEFSIGILVLYCTGQMLYSVVPGYGPVRELAGQFKSTFPHGLWVDSVMATVASGGAQKDIFPSLHTAMPVFLTLFSFRNRRILPFGYTWPVIAFFAGNIIIATLFLRWHWLIDVVAGLVLAWLGWWLGVRLTRFEFRRRIQHGLAQSWPAFEAPASCRIWPGNSSSH